MSYCEAMLLVEHQFTAPAENLACDEALLEFCEMQNGPELLRFWESPSYFVVLGYTKSLQQEMNVKECNRRDIPILRRCSGGGTVLQGRGCFNYSLICKIPDDEFPHNIPATNCRVMRLQRDIFRALLPGETEICGHTDLTWNGRKFSGNAQRRKMKYFLFHGTVLLDFSLEMISAVLLMPEIQPEYRAHRAHEDFITNVPLQAQEVQAAIKTRWNAGGVFHDLPFEQIEKLTREKYLNPQWNEKF